LTLADQITAASRFDRSRGEAAVTVACLAPADAPFILEMLGLGHGVGYRWTVARVAAEAVTMGRLGQEFSARELHGRLPARCRPMIAPALGALSGEGLAERTGRVALSGAPGARGRKVPVFRLTRAGESLAWDIAPLPGIGDRVMETRLI
jgi:hypothetical protein